MKRLIILILLGLTVVANSAGLDCATVILLVSEHRTGDPRMEAVKKELLAARERMGFSTEEMPIVFMGFKDSDTEKTYFDRLGFQSFDSPVLCVAEWGNPSRFGPKRVIDYAIARSATPQHVDYIVEQYLKATGRLEETDIGTNPKPNPTSTPIAGPTIGIVHVRFEASGKPLYLTNAGIRIKNNTDQTLRDITIRFFCKLGVNDSWKLMGKKTLQKLQVGYFATRDVVGDTREFGLVDTDGNAVKCLYRIEVQYDGNVISEEGEFIPSEGPVGLR